jgi:hypothetical protein
MAMAGWTSIAVAVMEAPEPEVGKSVSRQVGQSVSRSVGK